LFQIHPFIEESTITAREIRYNVANFNKIRGKDIQYGTVARDYLKQLELSKPEEVFTCEAELSTANLSKINTPQDVNTWKQEQLKLCSEERKYVLSLIGQRSIF
jgi:hypothetical protein